MGKHKDTAEEARIRAEVEAHPLLRYPKEERLQHREEWNQFFLLVMQFRGFLAQLEWQLQRVDHSNLAEDDRKLRDARFISEEKRKNTFDSVTFGEVLRVAVKNFDREKALDKESPFLAYFETLYARQLNKNANKEAAQRNESIQRLNKDEICILRLYTEFCAKNKLDPKEFDDTFYESASKQINIPPERIKHVMLKCDSVRRYTSLDAPEDEDVPRIDVADPNAECAPDKLEMVLEAVRAITAFADLDVQEYPRLFFTNDVLNPMCCGAPTVDATSYCALLERHEPLLWDKVLAEDYIQFVFAPPPQPDTLRHILAARQLYPLRDATIAACKKVTPAAVSYRRKKYTELMRRLAAEQSFDT